MPSVEEEQGEPRRDEDIWCLLRDSRGKREVKKSHRDVGCSGERVGPRGADQRIPEGTDSAAGER